MVELVHFNVDPDNKPGRLNTNAVGLSQTAMGLPQERYTEKVDTGIRGWLANAPNRPVVKVRPPGRHRMTNLVLVFFESASRAQTPQCPHHLGEIVANDKESLPAFRQEKARRPIAWKHTITRNSSSRMITVMTVTPLDTRR